MPITYDEVLREQIRDHLAVHDRRVVADPTKRHAAVAVLLVDSEIGEDRIDPAPGDDWNARCPRPSSTAGWSMYPAAPHSCCAAGRPASTRIRRSGRFRVVAWTPGRM